MLAIQKYIKKYGIDKTIVDFQLKTKQYDNKILLKYDQLVPTELMALDEMQDCRGLILEKNTWKVMALAFRKFFNSNETNAVKINWNTAKVLEKLDGTMIQVYWDWNQEIWFAATTGTAEGEGEVNNKYNTTFNELFWSTVNIKHPFYKELLNKDLIYVFELTTPYNVVVVPHKDSKATLLTVRNRTKLIELSFKDVQIIGHILGIPVVKEFKINNRNIDVLMETFKNMPWSEEGYVVVDDNFNRIKVKNPAYVAIHHLASKTAEHYILTIIKTNEIEEFISVFQERKEEIYQLKKNYDELILKLDNIWSELKNYKPKDNSRKEIKRYALKVFEICEQHNVNQFSKLYFELVNNRVATVEEFLFNYDTKRLYKIL